MIGVFVLDVFLFLLGSALIVIGLIGAIVNTRELRKLHRQIRHMAEIYFPQHINEAAQDGTVTVVETKVDVNDEWDEKEEPRG